MQAGHRGIVHQVGKISLFLLAKCIPQRVYPGFCIQQNVVAISLHLGAQALILGYSPARDISVNLVNLQVGQGPKHQRSPLLEPVFY